jgi:hypothetical protein
MEIIRILVIVIVVISNNNVKIRIQSRIKGVGIFNHVKKYFFNIHRKHIST